MYCATTGGCSGGRRSVDTARKASARKIRSGITNELAEERLSLADTLWQARKKLCPSAPVEEDEALALIMEKLAQ
jgi:hypothetical protein